MDNIKIIDSSGDKNYFTIVPNYVLNHSTANDQALYLQMKRYAGENGECFASERKLRQQLGIGVKGLKKSLKYLLDHEWIKNTGTKQVETKGGMQEIQVYTVIDIWKLNQDHYKGVLQSIPLNTKGVLQSAGGCSPKEAQGVLQRATKKNYTKEEPYKNIYTTEFENFWKEYPKKTGKMVAFTLWKNLHPSIYPVIMADIISRRADKKWREGFVKDPERYLKYRQWEDEIISEPTTKVWDFSKK